MLVIQGLQIDRDRAVRLNLGGAEAAVPAQLVAERDVNIDRQRLTRWKLCQPLRIFRLSGAIVKIRRRRIAGVAGHGGTEAPAPGRGAVMGQRTSVS